MSKSHVILGGVSLPKNLHTLILVRAIGEKRMIALYEEYKAARKPTGTKEMAAPTASEIEMCKLVKQYKSVAKTAKALGVKPNVVHKAQYRVAMWNFRNS